MMHPIERLRMVARAAGEGPALVAQEAAGALVAFGDDPAGLVTACRRLVDRQPTSGPPPQAAELEERGKRAGLYGAISNLAWVVVLVLMVWKPGL